MLFRLALLKKLMTSATIHCRQQISHIAKTRERRTIVAIGHNSDIWKVPRKQVPRPKHVSGLPSLDSITTETMDKHNVCLYRLCPRYNDFHAMAGQRIDMSSGCGGGRGFFGRWWGTILYYVLGLKQEELVRAAAC